MELRLFLVVGLIFFVAAEVLAHLLWMPLYPSSIPVEQAPEAAYRLLLILALPLSLLWIVLMAIMDSG